MQVLSMTVKKSLPLTAEELASISRECKVQIVALEALSIGLGVYSIEFFEGHKNEHVSTLLHLMSDNV